MEALNAVTAAAEYDRVIFLGDSVDYGPDPEPVVDWLRHAKDRGAILVRGNHDEAAATPVEQFDPSWWSETALRTLEYSRAKLSSDAKRFLGGLPLTAEVDLGSGDRGLACHGSPTSNLEYLWPTDPKSDLLRALGPAAQSCDYIFVGHSHLPFQVDLGEVVLVNPGSVGQPRDGDPRASFGLFDTHTGQLELRRVSYDVDATCRKLRENGVPLAERLCATLRAVGARHASEGR
jgi:diadenosine tetraphosphatase ApaH/serine/threonine PP2A family protein phosphatase